MIGLNSKERFDATFNFSKVDRVLTYDLLMNRELYEKFAGTEGSLIECNARMMKATGLDCTRGIYDPSEHWLSAKLKCWERFFGIASWGYKIERSGGTSWISGRPFNDLAGLKKNLPKMPEKDQVAEWYIPFLREVKYVFDRYDLVYIGETEGPLTDLYNFIGLELLAEAIYDTPDEVEYLLDVTTEWASILAELYCEFPVSHGFFLGDDVAYKTDVLFSPEWLRKNIYPRWKKILKPLKENKIKCIFHSDGNLYKILDDLVNDIAIDGLNPIEPSAGMDIVSIAQKYPKLVMLGNIDTTTVLAYGNTQDVQNTVTDLLGQFCNRGGLCLGSSTEVGDSVPMQNILAMYRAAREFSYMSASQ
jgi:hypothetical protein